MIASAVTHGVFDGAVPITAGLPLYAVSDGVCLRVAIPTEHGCWVVIDPMKVCPNREQDIECVYGTRDEIISLLRESIAPVLHAV